MALNSDKVLMQTLAAATVGGSPYVSNWFDLSAYVVGAFWIIETVGGTLTPTFQMSPDNGVTFITPIPVGELAAPGAIATPGAIRYPFIGPINQAWVRVSSAVTVSAVTAQVFFIGRTK
jgi:hypothetical protein